LLNDYITSLGGEKSKETPKAGGLKTIVIKYKETVSAEGYEMSITPASIHIFASTNTGAFYAIQSLKTMVPPGALADPKKSYRDTLCRN